MFEIKDCDINGDDATRLIGELNDALTALTGRSGAAGFDAADVQGPRGAFMVGYLDGAPLACGALRELTETTGEIKRVYARPNKVGAAHALLRALEERAAQNGFTRVCLETRRVNRHAVRFYLDCGYTVCPNYGRYAGRAEAVCFSKPLPGAGKTEIRRITQNKKQVLDLLLLADEQESMIDRYLARGELFALYANGLKAIAVVTAEGGGLCELKNLATVPASQGQGYGKKLVEYLCGHYRGQYTAMQVGTGDSPLTLPFYRSCGFTESHRVKNFFTDNYDHPIFEAGRQLVDMVYLTKKL